MGVPPSPVPDGPPQPRHQLGVVGVAAVDLDGQRASLVVGAADREHARDLTVGGLQIVCRDAELRQAGRHVGQRRAPDRGAHRQAHRGGGGGGDEQRGEGAQGVTPLMTAAPITPRARIQRPSIRRGRTRWGATVITTAEASATRTLGNGGPSVVPATADATSGHDPIASRAAARPITTASARAASACATMKIRRRTSAISIRTMAQSQSASARNPQTGSSHAGRLARKAWSEPLEPGGGVGDHREHDAEQRRHEQHQVGGAARPGLTRGDRERPDPRHRRRAHSPGGVAGSGRPAGLGPQPRSAQDARTGRRSLAPRIDRRSRTASRRE